MHALILFVKVLPHFWKLTFLLWGRFFWFYKSFASSNNFCLIETIRLLVWLNDTWHFLQIEVCKPWYYKKLKQTFNLLILHINMVINPLDYVGKSKVIQSNVMIIFGATFFARCFSLSLSYRFYTSITYYVCVRWFYIHS